MCCSDIFLTFSFPFFLIFVFFHVQFHCLLLLFLHFLICLIHLLLFFYFLLFIFMLIFLFFIYPFGFFSSTYPTPPPPLLHSPCHDHHPLFFSFFLLPVSLLSPLSSFFAFFASCTAFFNSSSFPSLFIFHSSSSSPNPFSFFLFYSAVLSSYFSLVAVHFSSSSCTYYLFCLPRVYKISHEANKWHFQSWWSPSYTGHEPAIVTLFYCFITQYVSRFMLGVRLMCSWGTHLEKDTSC